jgi:hypothetical protein
MISQFWEVKRPQSYFSMEDVCTAALAVWDSVAQILATTSSNQKRVSCGYLISHPDIDSRYIMTCTHKKEKSDCYTVVFFKDIFHKKVVKCIADISDIESKPPVKSKLAIFKNDGRLVMGRVTTINKRFLYRSDLLPSGDITSPYTIVVISGTGSGKSRHLKLLLNGLGVFTTLS